MTFLKTFGTGLASLAVGLWLIGLSPAGAASGDDLYALSDGVAVHREPGASTEVVITLEQGRRLRELRREDGWVKALVYGEIGLDGWVRAGDVGPQPPGAADAEQAVEAVATDGPAEDTDTPERPRGQFLLLIRGDRQSFDGNCRIIRRDGSRDRVEFSDYAPKSYSIDAAAVRCRVNHGGTQPAGLLVVQLQQRGLAIATNQTSSFVGCVRVQSRGPWGAAGGARCSRVALPRFR